MPIYIFSNPEDGNDIIEVVQSVHDEHVYEKDGVKWNREFTVPQASIDTKWDKNNPRDFVEKTKNKKGTIGDVMDKSKELSSEREKSQGRDPYKENYYKQYKKERNGRDHPDVRKRKLKKKLEKTNFYMSD